MVMEILKTGDCVAAATRKAGRYPVPEAWRENLLTLELDVSDPDEDRYREAVNLTLARFGRIDVLINNAGYGGVTCFEETSEESLRQMFEVNVFGLMRVTRGVLPVMRRQRSGHIFNIASGAGYSAGPVPYHTSKFAVTGFSTALAFEVAPFGIHVTNVAPGLFRTGFYDKGKWRTEPDLHIPDYDPFRWQTEFVREARCHQQPGDPVKLARLLVEAAGVSQPPLHLPAGEDAPAVLDSWCASIQADTDAWRSRAAETSFDGKSDAF